MLDVFAKSFMTATRNETYDHQGKRDRFAERRCAALIAHTEGRLNV